MHERNDYPIECNLSKMFVFSPLDPGVIRELLNGASIETDCQRVLILWKCIV